MMKKNVHNPLALTVFIVFFLLAGIGHCLEGTEYQIKGAMMINFIKFVEWPDHVILDSNGKITIGIIGANLFGNTLDPIEGKSVGGKQLSIRYITSLNQLSGCQVLFVGASEPHLCYQVLRKVSGMPVLTIGEDDDFTRMGGIIRFFNEKNHIRFEINQTAALKSDLKLSAKLLEIAAAIY